MTKADPILRVEALSVSFGALRALTDMSWSIAPGEVLGIIGPNGAGKSTCYDAATHMVRRQGRVFLDGRDVTALSPWDLAPLGLRRTFQQNVFFAGLSVIENMASVLVHRFAAPLAISLLAPWVERRRWQAARVSARQMLARFGIPEDPPLAQLGGMNVTRVYLAVFAVEGAAVALAGSIATTHVPILTSMGFDEVIVTFVVVVLGGAGSIVGSYVAGVGLGLFNALFSALVSPAYTSAASFVVLIVILLVRPPVLVGGRA